MNAHKQQSRGSSAQCLGVGCDVENVARIEEVLTRRPAFLQRWFTAHERARIEASAKPHQLACSIFATKEACIKALWMHVKCTPKMIELREEGPCLLEEQKGILLESSCQIHADFVEVTVEAWLGKD